MTKVKDFIEYGLRKECECELDTLVAKLGLDVIEKAYEEVLNGKDIDTALNDSLKYYETHPNKRKRISFNYPSQIKTIREYIIKKLSMYSY